MFSSVLLKTVFKTVLFFLQDVSGSIPYSTSIARKRARLITFYINSLSCTCTFLLADFMIKCLNINMILLKS